MFRAYLKVSGGTRYGYDNWYFFLFFLDGCHPGRDNRQLSKKNNNGLHESLPEKS